MRIIVSAGGTGGHIYPALAIIKEFQKQEKDLEVLYIGTHNRMENKIIPEHNIPYQAIEIYGLSKSDLKRNFKNVHLLIKAYEKCIDIMKEFKPDAVIGVGGYVTFPVIMAARKLNIKTFIHEQNCIPGKSNKFLSRGVDEVFVSFKSSAKYFKSKKVLYTGNPSMDNVKNLKPIKKESLGLTKDKKLILVTSGSLGSSALNEKIIDFLRLSSKDDFEVLMITGENNYQTVTKNEFSKNIKILPYLNNMAAIFHECDLIISRAGASTIAEIIGSDTPSIIIPSPYVANNHQYYNAFELNESGAAVMLEEKNLTGKVLYDEVKRLLNNEKALKNLKDNLKKYNNINSSETIYKEIKESL